MTADELDDYLERARIESASVAAPADFTDRVMRSVRAPASAPAHVDLLTSTVPSGALVASGALLMLTVGGATTLAAVVLMAIGFLWMWVDDPFGAEMTIRLTPW